MTLESEFHRWESTRSTSFKTISGAKSEFKTPSGIPLPRLLTPEDPDPDIWNIGFPGRVSLHARRAPTCTAGALDDAPVRWLRQRKGIQPAYHYLLEQDRPAVGLPLTCQRRSLDADDPIAAGELASGCIHLVAGNMEDPCMAFSG